MVIRVSACEKMYQSRLLSCPTYLWYSSGGWVPSYGLPSVRRYHCVTISTPSALSAGTRSRMGLLVFARAWKEETTLSQSSNSRSTPMTWPKWLSGVGTGWATASASVASEMSRLRVFIAERLLYRGAGASARRFRLPADVTWTSGGGCVRCRDPNFHQYGFAWVGQL